MAPSQTPISEKSHYQTLLQPPHVSSTNVLVLERQLHQVQCYVLRPGGKRTIREKRWTGNGEAAPVQRAHLWVDDVDDDILISAQFEGLSHGLVHADCLWTKTKISVGKSVSQEDVSTSTHYYESDQNKHQEWCCARLLNWTELYSIWIPCHSAHQLDICSWQLYIIIYYKRLNILKCLSFLILHLILFILEIRDNKNAINHFLKVMAMSPECVVYNLKTQRYWDSLLLQENSRKYKRLKPGARSWFAFFTWRLTCPISWLVLLAEGLNWFLGLFGG